MAGQGGYEVSNETLRNEASVWDQQAQQMGAIAQKCNDLKMDGIQSGVFLLMVNAYGEVVNDLQARSLEGQKAMGDIGAGLRQVAENYEQQETRHAASFRGLTPDHG